MALSCHPMIDIDDIMNRIRMVIIMTLAKKIMITCIMFVIAEVLNFIYAAGCQISD